MIQTSGRIIVFVGQKEGPIYIAWSDVTNIHLIHDFPVALRPGQLIKKILFVLAGSIPATPGQDFFFFFRCNFSKTEGRYI